VVELLDDLFQAAASADEPPERNFVRKHALELQAAGESVEASTARIFSNPPGEFGSLVNERVSDSSWTDEGSVPLPLPPPPPSCCPYHSPYCTLSPPPRP
jgi:cobalamin biosynthesis Mg chelatase CobN